MQKFLSFVLLLILGVPSALPLFAAVAGDAGSDVPLCCRRAGRHHCMMQTSERDRAAGAHSEHVMRMAGETCPYQCAMISQAHVNPVLLGHASLRLDAALVAHPAVQAQTESRWRVARERARGKRGPPETSRSQRVS